MSFKERKNDDKKAATWIHQRFTKEKDEMASHCRVKIHLLTFDVRKRAIIQIKIY